MAKGRGKLAYIQVDVGSSVFKDLSNITDMTISQSMMEIASSDADTLGWEEFLNGDREATIDVTLNFTGASTQEIINAAWLAGTTFAIKYGYRAYTSAFATTVKVNSMTIDAPADGVRTMKATLRIITAPTTTTASLNADTAGTYGKQRGKSAALLLQVPTITGTTAVATAIITLSAAVASQFKPGQRLMIVGSEKVHTVLSATGSAITLTANTGTLISGGIIYAEIENRTTMSFNGTQGEIDSTDALSTNFKEYISGDSGMTIDINLNYDDDAKVQENLITNYYNSTAVNSRWVYGVAATKLYYKAPIIVTKADITSPQAGVQTMAATLRVATKPTTTAQA